MRHKDLRNLSSLRRLLSNYDKGRCLIYLGTEGDAWTSQKASAVKAPRSY